MPTSIPQNIALCHHFTDLRCEAVVHTVLISKVYSPHGIVVSHNKFRFCAWLSASPYY